MGGRKEAQSWVRREGRGVEIWILGSAQFILFSKEFLRKQF